jgi:protein-tyrosine phosphatase
VSLLEPSEAADIGLKEEERVCADLGIKFVLHPVRDMHLPEPAAFAALTADLASRLRDGAYIAVHCYASIGRSGMLACATLGHFGYAPAEAIAHVSQMRGTPVPDTPEQAAFIHHIMTHERS